MTIKESLDWYRNLEVDSEFIVEELKYDFAKDLESFMRDKQITKSDLAAIIQTSPAYITKVLRGDVNLTIETMSKLSRAIGCALHIHIAPVAAKVHWFDVHTNDLESNEIESNASLWANSVIEERHEATAD